jgi:hypothetical protein
MGWGYDQDVDVIMMDARKFDRTSEKQIKQPKKKKMNDDKGAKRRGVEWFAA